MYQDDHFLYEDGLTPVLEHKPEPLADRSPDCVIAAYAVATLPGGGVEFEVLWRSDLDRARANSPSGDHAGAPWSVHYGEMCEKTVLNLLTKRLPRHPLEPVPPPEVMGWEPVGVETIVVDDAEVVVADPEQPPADGDPGPAQGDPGPAQEQEQDPAPKPKTRRKPKKENPTPAPEATPESRDDPGAPGESPF